MKGSPPPKTATSGSTSSGLLERVKSRDPDGWSKLVQIYSPLVYGLARRAGLQASDAADVVQEVFRAVAQNIANFRREKPNDSFHGWLWTITRNKVRDQFRRRSSQPQAEGGTDGQTRLLNLPDDLAADEKSAEIASQYDATHRLLESVRAEFEPKTWQAFWFTVAESRAAAEAAEKLGMSIGAVYIAKSRVLARIREEAAGLMDE
jgi:RNA polymerase sigma-70 factor (ECF subfamily)